MLSFQEEQEAALKEGSLAVERYDDVLGKSLPSREHPGRVRGVGGELPIKKTYGKSGRRSRPSSSRSEEDLDKIVDQRVEERVEKLRQDIREEMRLEMRQEMAIMLQQTIGQQGKTNTPTLVESSCQSVKQITDLSGFTEVMQIQILIYFSLHVIHIILFE